MVAVGLLAGCPGYLEEQAWITDAGRPPGTPAPPGSDAPVASGTGGSAPVAPVAGTGGSTGGSGGSGGGGGSSEFPKMDAAKAPDGGGKADGGGAPDVQSAPQPRECATGPEITSKILMPKCSRCHQGNNPSGGLNLALPNAKMRLLNVMARCQGKLLVTDSPVVGGHFFDKLSGAVQGCGMRMPQGGMQLSADEISCLKEWIKPEPAPPPPPAAGGCSTAEEIQIKILTPKCGNCHGRLMAAGNLDLVSPGSKARLLNIPSRACNNRPLIVDSPEVGGHFFDKLAGAVPGCGNQMPFGGLTPLSAAEVKCLKDWIKPTP